MRIAPEKFWAQVDRRGAGECWSWLGRKLPAGYGVINYGVRRSEFGDTVVETSTTAHRVAYEFLVGPIPEGLTLDHLCLNTSCVNPAHLEPCTRAENTRRQRAAQKAAS